ncbi:MAG: UDP-N-acetylmuramoyl-tripeptide--D-alanyl-D-alanine ligase [Bacteroidetes bacterium]|nr:UDP-N-acetylmuramoyl-tripeptide--D-alanyl-D-alanine ligase [Bacteroidota bacterium]
MTISEIYKIFQLHPVISTDSRKILPGSLFFALKGENFNANVFAEQAIHDGAAYAVIDEIQFQKSDKFILVDDVLKCLQELAAYHRSTLKFPVIGITGTNGKTTTKELINAVLSEKYLTLATAGNLNNHIGVPLSLLSINEKHEIAIIEMGANHIGEIAELCAIAQPDFGIITNIGKAHLEGFGGIEGVIETKKALYEAILKKKGKVFINSDNALLMELADGIDKITFANNKPAYCQGSIVDADPFVKISYQHKDFTDEIQTQLVGAYNFENIMAAITVGHYFGIEASVIKKALTGYQPSNSRSQVLKISSNTIIQDAYNANPTSLEAAILNFSLIKANEKVLIIGDMLELGEFSKPEHSRIIEIINENNFQQVILVGPEFSAVSVNPDWHVFMNAEVAKEWLMQHRITNSYILLKASRGIKLEKLIDAL